MSRIDRWRAVPAAALFVVLFICALPALAHGPIHEQIAAVTTRIRLEPGSASLYLKRSRLLAQHEEWTAALLDLDVAARIDPNLDVVHLARGRVLLLSGRSQDTLEALDRYVARRPDHPEVLLLRAQVLARLGRRDEAATEQERALTLREAAGEAEPEAYLDHARLLGCHTRSACETALATLDRGIARLGPIAALQTLAIDLELEQGRWEGAVARVETMMRQSAREDAWLVRRAEIFDRAGRPAEALLAYREARAAVEGTGGSRRSPAGAELEEKIHAAIRRLEMTPVAGRR